MVSLLAHVLYIAALQVITICLFMLVVYHVSMQTMLRTLSMDKLLFLVSLILKKVKTFPTWPQVILQITDCRH